MNHALGQFGPPIYTQQEFGTDSAQVQIGRERMSRELDPENNIQHLCQSLLHKFSPINLRAKGNGESQTVRG